MSDELRKLYAEVLQGADLGDGITPELTARGCRALRENDFPAALQMRAMLHGEIALGGNDAAEEVLELLSDDPFWAGHTDE